MQDSGFTYENDDFDDGYEDGVSAVFAYSLVGFSGFLVGLIATWIF